jgi:outer membrane protein assembly factor BamA
VVFRWLVVVQVLLGCSGRARVHGPQEIWLKEIRIDGNREIPDDDLIPGLALDRTRRDGLRVDPYQLSLDTKRIKGAYVRMGFFEAKVDSRIDRKGNAEIAVFTVVEGPRSIARVAVTGLPPELPAGDVLAKLELKDGDPFDYDLYDDGKEIVKALVEDAGYPHVDLDESAVDVDRKARVAATTYRVTLSGPRAKFGPIKIVGLRRYPALEEAARGRLTIREGERYSPRALADTNRALQELGRFGTVKIDPDRSARSDSVPITITLRFNPRPETKIGLGVGFDLANYEGRIRFGGNYIPLDYPLWSMSGEARLAANHPRFDAEGNNVAYDLDNFQPRVRVITNFQRSEMFRPYLVGDIGVGLDLFTAESYTAAGPLLRLGVTSPLGVKWLTAQVGWALTWFSFSNVANIDPVRRNQLGLRENETNGRFEQAIAADLRDKALDPRKGMFFGLRVSEGGLFAGGEYNYLLIQPDVRGYIPIGRQSVLAFRARGGSFFGEVPMTQRFFLGGAQSHRGFGARDLSPIELVFDAETGIATGVVPIGGASFLETGAELRVPLAGKPGSLQPGVTLFLDGGDNALSLDELELGNLHWATGFGVFAKYGGFKLRVDFGYRLNRVGSNPSFGDRFTWFIGVGETF